MKQVVFIAGTSYSGSSMLDMMLGNSTSSFSTGEVKYLFEPTRKYHINPSCDCGDAHCTIWTELKKVGKHEFYSEIFNRFDKIQTIIDSSKDLFWISERKKELISTGIDVRVLLIWKNPEEFALSRYKRGLLSGWQKAWIDYHRLFFSLNKEWRSVEYRNLAIRPDDTLKKICSALSISYKKNMEHYWLKKHHMLFGNLSAKYHMFDKDEQKYKNTLENLNYIESKINNRGYKIESKHRKISYDTGFKKKLPKAVMDSTHKPIFLNLISVIKSRDIERNLERFSDKNLKSFFLSKPSIEIYRAKRFLKEKLFYLQTSIKW